jgi:hypothetical protein
MVFTRKFSEFVPGDVDEVVGLSGGANTIGPNSGGGGGSGSVIETIQQDTTALTVGRWVRFDDATQLYVHGVATSAELAEIVGVVLEITSNTEFKLQQSGYIESGTPGFNGFSTAGTYFLSDTAGGLQTLTPPTTNGYIRLPLFIADSADSGWVCSLKTGMVIGSPGPIPSSGGGGGGDDTSTHIINQPGNTFNVGDWVRVSGNTIYSLADGSTFANSQGVGVVIDDGDPLFEIQFSGFVSGIIIGAVDAAGAPIAITSSTVYYLSDVVPGAITPTKPTGLFSSVKPCYISESSTSLTGFILPQQPLEVKPGDDDPSFVVVTQNGHGFSVEDCLRVLASGTYIEAQADTLTNARAVGIVVEVIDANTFVLQTSGFTDKITGKTAATQYFLSASTAGLLTSTEPSADGEYSKPMYQSLTADSGYILEQRPMVQPNANGGASGGGGGGMPANLVQTVVNTSLTIPPLTDLPFSVTITPSSASSRVRIMFSGINYSGGRVYLKRNGVILTSGGINVAMYVSGSRTNSTFLYIDSPATTSPVTYVFFTKSGSQFYYSAGGGDQDGVLTMTAEEIGAAVLPVLNNNIVQTTYGGPNFSVGANTDFPFSVTITPSSVTSRIRIQFLGNGNISPVQSCFLKRNGVIITIGGVKAGFSGTTVANFVFIDSPSTTSAITYNFVTNSAGGTYSYNSGSNVPFIVMIAEEIGP